MNYADDRNAGKIIDFVCSWYPHAKRRRKYGTGVWSVFARQELCAGSGLSLKQYRRAMPVAVRCGAVDFIIGGHAGKKAIFTRPTAALTRFLREATDRRSALKLRPKGPDGGPNGGPNPIQPSLPSQSTIQKDQKPVPGRKGRAADRLPPVRSTPPPTGGLAEPRLTPEPVPCPAEPESLLSRVQAAQASGLDDSALREELMRLLPPYTRKHQHKIWHPSEKYPAWQTWSPEKLVEKHRLYERYVDNWYRSHKDASRPVAGDNILPLEDMALYVSTMRNRGATYEELLRYTQKYGAGDEAEAMAALTFEEWERGYNIN